MKVVNVLFYMLGLFFLLGCFENGTKIAGPENISADPKVSGDCNSPRDSVYLTWDAVPVIPVSDGYKVYFGEAPGVYEAPIDVGMTTTPDHPAFTLVMDFQAGKKYYFAVTAYGSTTGESLPSKEVVLNAFCVNGVFKAIMSGRL